MAMTDIRPPVTAEAQFRIQAIHVTFMALWFPLSVSFHLCHILTFHSYAMDAAQFKQLTQRFQPHSHTVSKLY
jgi:hypothetical protein